MFDKGINPTSLQDFKTHLHGELIVPGDDTYDSARKVWNGMIDKYPAAIARCADVADVLRSVQFARVKNAYDPTNFLHLNHNIKPTGER